jgi:hypothetical protein
LPALTSHLVGAPCISLLLLSTLSISSVLLRTRTSGHVFITTSFLFWNSGNITLTGFEAKYAICDLVSSLATFPRESELRPTYFFSDSFCNFQHIY